MKSINILLIIFIAFSLEVSAQIHPKLFYNNESTFYNVPNSYSLFNVTKSELDYLFLQRAEDVLDNQYNFMGWQIGDIENDTFFYPDTFPDESNRRNHSLTEWDVTGRGWDILHILPMLAVSYKIYGNSNYLNYAKKYLGYVCNTNDNGNPITGGWKIWPTECNADRNLDLETLYLCYAVCAAYDILYNDLPAGMRNSVRDKLYQEIVLEGDNPSDLNYPSDNYWYDGANNHHFHDFNQILFAAITIKDDYDKNAEKERYDKVIKQLNTAYQNIILVLDYFNNQGFYEGHLYNNFTLLYLLMAAEALRNDPEPYYQSLGNNIFEHEVWDKMIKNVINGLSANGRSNIAWFDFHSDMWVYGGKFDFPSSFSDYSITDHGMGGIFFEEICHLIANYYGNGHILTDLATWYIHFTNGMYTSDERRNFYLKYLLFLRSYHRALLETDILPSSFNLSNIDNHFGSATLRNSFSNDGTMLQIVNQNHLVAHAHHDANAIALNYKGSWLLASSAYPTQENLPIRQYGLSSQSHNTVWINNAEDQQFGYAEKKIEFIINESDLMIICSDASRTYKSLDLFKRYIIFSDNPDVDSDYFVIFDEMKANASDTKFQLNLHPAGYYNFGTDLNAEWAPIDVPVPLLNTAYFEALNLNQILQATFLSTDNWNPNIQEGKIDSSYQKGHDYSDCQNPYYISSMEVEGKNKNFLLFLYPYEESSLNVHFISRENISNGDLGIIKVGSNNYYDHYIVSKNEDDNIFTDITSNAKLQIVRTDSTGVLKRLFAHRGKKLILDDAIYLMNNFGEVELSVNSNIYNWTISGNSINFISMLGPGQLVLKNDNVYKFKLNGIISHFVSNPNEVNINLREGINILEIYIKKDSFEDYSSGFPWKRVVHGDFDGDGNTEVAMIRDAEAYQMPNHYIVAIRDPDGTLTGADSEDKTKLNSPWADITVADINNDGDDEIILIGKPLPNSNCKESDLDSLFKGKYYIYIKDPWNPNTKQPSNNIAWVWEELAANVGYGSLKFGELHFPYSKINAGDFDGDGDKEIVALRNTCASLEYLQNNLFISNHYLIRILDPHKIIGQNIHKKINTEDKLGFSGFDNTEGYWLDVEVADFDNDGNDEIALIKNDKEYNYEGTSHTGYGIFVKDPQVQIDTTVNYPGVGLIETSGWAVTYVDETSGFKYSDIEVGDFDNDGNKEIVAIRNTCASLLTPSDSLFISNHYLVRILDPDSSLKDHASEDKLGFSGFNTSKGYWTDVEVGDFNGDGDDEVFLIKNLKEYDYEFGLDTGFPIIVKDPSQPIDMAVDYPDFQGIHIYGWKTLAKDIGLSTGPWTDITVCDQNHDGFADVFAISEEPFNEHYSVSLRYLTDWLLVTGIEIDESNQNKSNKGIVLEDIFPNPFNSVVTLKFYLPREEKTLIIIYNVLGQKIKEIINRDLESGNHVLTWDGRNKYGITVASGVYFMLFKTENYIKVKKMLLIK